MPSHQTGPTLESLGRMVEVARHHKDSLAHDEETCEALLARPCVGARRRRRLRNQQVRRAPQQIAALDRFLVLEERLAAEALARVSRLLGLVSREAA